MVHYIASKAWNAFGWLAIIWKSDLSNKIKQDFCGYVNTTIEMYHKDADKMQQEKVRWELHKNAICCFEEILEVIPHKQLLYGQLPPPPSSQKPSKWGEQDMRGIAGKVRTKTCTTVSYGLQHIDISVLANQQRLISFYSEWRLDAV